MWMGAAALILGACSSMNRTAPGAGSRIVTLTDSANGTSVTIHGGDSVKVILSSTYWTFQDSSNTAILRSDGTAKVVPQPSGCVPGQGCGTVTQMFTGLSVGTTTIVAMRSVCGEALRCTGANGQYEVTVHVT
jgi:hypothetical protein